MTTTPEKSLLNELSSSSYYEPSNPSVKSLIKRIYTIFNQKYSKMPHTYNVNIIDNIIYNEKSHIVAEFKDRLIIDDNGEFLKRFYKKKESDVRLPKFFEYYDLYSKIFPNYTTFYEGKYLYQNIQRKQRMIDLQEKLEMQAKQNKEKDSSGTDSENKEKVFNTDAIDSILNGTNNEGMEILFSVNKNNIKQDEEIFDKEVNDIIDKINVFEIKAKKMNEEKYNKNNVTNITNNNNNYKNIDKDTIWNKNISLPININYSKNKRLRNSSSMNTINTNITYYNNIQSIISKFFNISSHQKNNFLNLHNVTNKNSRISSKTKCYPKKDKKLVDKLEQNLFKMRQKSLGFQKNLSQNISTSNQTQKDISISKKNSSIYNKKPSSSTSSAHNQKCKIKDSITNSSTSYKILKNNFINTVIKKKNIDISKKGSSPFTSRNPLMNKTGLNVCKTKIKDIKGNIYYQSDITSRNKYSNNLNSSKKAKSTLKGRIYSCNSKARDNKKSSSKKKNTRNDDKIKKSEYKFGKTLIGYKEISYIKNGIKNSNKKIRERFLCNEKKNNNSRNNARINKNISQPKTDLSQRNKNISRNNSTLRLGILEMINMKNSKLKGINVNNISKNTNSKNKFSKTHRSCFGLYNK